MQKKVLFEMIFTTHFTKIKLIIQERLILSNGKCLNMTGEERVYCYIYSMYSMSVPMVTCFSEHQIYPMISTIDQTEEESLVAVDRSEER